MTRTRTIALAAGLALAATATIASAQEGTEVVITPAVTTGDVDAFTLSLDGQFIFFVGSVDDGVSGDHLYRVPIAGGTAEIWNDPTLHNDVDEAPIVGQDFVYFKGDQTIGNPSNEWFRLPIPGGDQLQITDGTGVAGDGVLIKGGTELIYLNDESSDGIFNALTDGSFDIFGITPLDVDIDQFQWDVTEDGETVIYGSQFAGGPQPQVLGVLPTDGSSFDPQFITPTNVPDFWEIVDGELTPDGQYFVCTADWDFADTQSLVRIPTTIGEVEVEPIVSLDGEFQDIDGLAVSPDGTKVAFSGDVFVDTVDSLYVVNIDGTGLRELTPDLPVYADVNGGYGDIRWSADSSRIYFIRDKDFDGLNTIYYVDVDGSTPCRADIDGDGELTIFDFLGFQNLFDAGDLAADFDGDGSLSLFDFLAFQNEFDAGCA
ncbi:MAG: GC-type dockerin domain-anchored protein [Phycisphaerales bacterium]